MKRYGLQIRVLKKLPPAKPPLAATPPVAFGGGHDDADSVEVAISRQAYRNKTHRVIEEQHKKALEEDPSVFEYDGVYDEMKAKQVRPKELEHRDRKPRYIQALMDKAKQREREHEIIYERKLAKERSQDEHLYADKDKFVTSAYKRKLAEQAKWMEEERLREMREEKEDVTKKTDLSDFYFNLNKNVAFGAREAGLHKREKQPEEVAVESTPLVSPPETLTEEQSDHPKKPTPETSAQDQIIDEPSASSQPRADHHIKEQSDHPKAPTSETSAQDQATDEPSASNQPTADHHKRSEDAVAAAKARFLARKKAKV